jgi:hypothetical protein
MIADSAAGYAASTLTGAETEVLTVITHAAAHCRVTGDEACALPLRQVHEARPRSQRNGISESPFCPR